MNKIIVTFKKNVDQSLLKKHGIEEIKTFKNLKNISICYGNNVDIESLLDEQEVIGVEYEQDDPDDSTDSDDNQKESYAIDMHEIKKFHDKGYKGEGVKVAVLDRGCQPHEDLNISGGYNAYDDNNDYMKDSNGHGTHVAGIIGMQDNDKGYLGIAPNCELYVIKRSSATSTSSSREAQIRGIDWAISKGIEILSISFSGSRDSIARRKALETAVHEHDMIVLCSAGNNQKDTSLDIDTMGYPARYPFVYTVANVREDHTRSPNSSVGKNLNFSGAGQSIMSTCYTSSNSGTTSDKYCSKTGTSMSTPAVAGIVALYKQMFPNLNRDELMEKVIKNCENIGNTREFGSGIPKYPTSNKSISMKHHTPEGWENINPTTLAKNVSMLGGQSVEQMINVLDGELGNNENGHYFKMNNGLVLSWGTTETTLRVTEKVGEIYRSNVSSRWYFPIPFIDNNYFVSGSTGSNNRWAETTSEGNTTNVQFRHFATKELNDYKQTKVFAIGRWK